MTAVVSLLYCPKADLSAEFLRFSAHERQGGFLSGGESVGDSIKIEAGMKSRAANHQLKKFCMEQARNFGGLLPR